MLFTKILYNHLVRDKCFDTQEKSVPHDKVKKTHNKVQKTHNKRSETHKPETLSKLRD
jgi:hypothetical protein